jgi:hypothetical protein
VSVDAAFVELAAAKKTIRASRRAFAQTHSVFVKAMWSAMAQYSQAIQQGVSREDAAKGLEEEIRGAWPKSVSKFKPACDSCDDTGYIDRVCWDRHRCQREVCAHNPERQHSYVEICHCPKGDLKRPKQHTPDDAFSGAGRTGKKKPRGFTRFGS